MPTNPLHGCCGRLLLKAITTGCCCCCCCCGCGFRRNWTDVWWWCSGWPNHQRFQAPVRWKKLRCNGVSAFRPREKDWSLAGNLMDIGPTLRKPVCFVPVASFSDLGPGISLLEHLFVSHTCRMPMISKNTLVLNPNRSKSSNLW